MRVRACLRARLNFVRGGEKLGVLREPLRVSTEEAWRLVEEGRAPVFLDTRNARHYAQSDVQIPGSLYIRRDELEARIDEVPRGRPVVTYCA
jgi:rhodanese-related sulfurtransferase